MYKWSHTECYAVRNYIPSGSITGYVLIYKGHVSSDQYGYVSELMTKRQRNSVQGYATFDDLQNYLKTAGLSVKDIIRLQAHLNSNLFDILVMRYEDDK